jgi:hypothetical protein
MRAVGLGSRSRIASAVNINIPWTCAADQQAGTMQRSGDGTDLEQIRKDESCNGVQDQKRSI